MRYFGRSMLLFPFSEPMHLPRAHYTTSANISGAFPSASPLIGKAIPQKDDIDDALFTWHFRVLKGSLPKPPPGSTQRSLTRVKTPLVSTWS